MSDTDDSFNFLISMCYTQLFNLLCEKADDVYGGRLPVHVRCLIDEAANIGQIPRLEKLVATIRSREISACLVLQAQSQLKAIYKDNADTIIGNMDTSIFLGGKEPTTLKELAAVLGKETIDTYNTGESRGRETSHSLNYQKLGKELMSQDELAVMDGTLLILSGAITLAFALFAALPAARSAARVSPIMAMSGTNLKIRRRKRKAKKIHNFEAYYARLNLKRNKGRTAITILSLVMSITVFIALQGFSSLLNAASTLQDNHLGDYQITNESVGFTADDLNTLQKNEAVQSVAAIQFSLYEQNENGQLDGISLEFQLKPGETFQVVGLNDEYWDYFMGDQLSEEQLEQLKSGNACIVRNPIPMSYGEDVLEFTNIEAGESICVAGTELDVLKTLDGYDGYLGIGNGGFTNGVQVIVDDAIYERLTGKDTYSEFLPTLNEGADRENFDTFIEAFCNRTPGTTFLSYEETDQQLKESFAQIQMLAWGLILFVGLIGILNIINTVYTNIHTRVTEIGMQRAIGMSADSLYKTFLWEGAYYGIIASVIGSVLGYVCTIFIEAATSDTIQLVAIPVMPILEATLLAVGACLLATAIPLRKISKMSIVDSIETVE